jgi:hypothetical protein
MPDQLEPVPQSKIISVHGHEAGWVGDGGIQFNTLYFGAGDPTDAPVALFLKADGNVGDRIAGLRTHSVPVLQTVIEGDAQIDGRWCVKGDMQLVAPGVEHGDLVIGPHGATLMLLFAKRSGVLPAFVDSGDQSRFDTTCRATAELVAAGKSEASFVLLPPRPEHTPRRGIVLLDSESHETEASSAGADRPGLIWTTITDDSLPWGPSLLNARTSLIVLGQLDDKQAPTVGVINVGPGPGDRLRARHIHKTSAVNLVIEGALYMDGVWLRNGEARVVSADLAYGDGLVGPEGVKFLEIWADQFGVEPIYEDPEDDAFFKAKTSSGHLQERWSVE